MKKNISRKRNPHLRGDQPLDFDNIENEELLALSDEEKVDRFISYWMRVMHPITKYKKYFDNSEKTIDRILRDVKIYYKTYVVEGSYSEKQYVMILDHMFRNNIVLYSKNFDKMIKLYNEGKLISQIEAEKVARRRRDRI